MGSRSCFEGASVSVSESALFSYRLHCGVLPRRLSPSFFPAGLCTHFCTDSIEGLTISSLGTQIDVASLTCWCQPYVSNTTEATAQWRALLDVLPSVKALPAPRRLHMRFGPPCALRVWDSIDILAVVSRESVQVNIGMELVGAVHRAVWPGGDAGRSQSG